ncbi:MAG: hypothetical protein ACREXU_22985, partial [Gammaproteobacteria bacterium]
MAATNGIFANRCSVILTAITDSMGFFISLGLAALFLVCVCGPAAMPLRRIGPVPFHDLPFHVLDRVETERFVAAERARRRAPGAPITEGTRALGLIET